MTTKLLLLQETFIKRVILIKTQGNAGYIDIVEANIFDEAKIKSLFEKADICINLIGILFEKKRKLFQKYSHFIPRLY